MKAVMLLALATAAAAAPVTSLLACQIPEKYATRNAGACAGPAAGYKVNMFCEGAYQTTLAENLVEKQTFELTAATASAWSSIPMGLEGCLVPSVAGESETGYVVPRIAAAMGCAAGANPFANAAEASVIKGATITCDAAANFYPTQGTEGSMFCNEVATGPWSTIPTVSMDSYWQTGFGNEQNVADWDATNSNGDLTCAKACTIPAPYCQNNAVHSNLVVNGGGKIANSCMVKPNVDTMFYCKSNPDQFYTATCTPVANDLTTSQTISFPNGAPSCAGSLDGMATGAYTLPQGQPASQAAGAINGFDAVTSTVSSITTGGAGALNGQWGGIQQRALEAFDTATSYNVDVSGCAAATNRADCVQKTLNWWRCEGLTVDSASQCYANGVAIACPTHTNGHRCESSSSKKGLLGLLGLVLVCPLLLLCCLLCLCCILPAIFGAKKSKAKKANNEAQFATFDPLAAPVVGSIAPATACYAPSYGAPMMAEPCAVSYGAPVMDAGFAGACAAPMMGTAAPIAAPMGAPIGAPVAF